MSVFKRADGGAPVGSVVGPVRLSRPGAAAGAGMRSGDIAVFDQPDLDRATAESLVAAGVAAVVNIAASSSVSGIGPQVLADAGIPLIDSVGEGLLARLRSGDQIRIVGGQIYRADELVGSGAQLHAAAADPVLTTAPATAAAAEVPAGHGLSSQVDTLAANATDHVRREHTMLLDGAGIPQLHPRLCGRPVVVVSDAYDARVDLRRLKRFIGDRDPVLIAAGTGAEVLIAAGYRPHVVIGTTETLSPRAVKFAAQIVVVTASGAISAPERFEKHGRDLLRFVADGDDTDLALLLADEAQAPVIVHVGAPPSLAHLLDQPAGLGGAAFVARLRAGAKIVDAKAVQHFSTHRIGWWPVLLLGLAAVAALGAAIATTSLGPDLIQAISARFDDVRTWIEGFLS